VLNQALVAAGGTSAIAAITDYTATGTIAYPAQGPDAVGTISIKGRGVNQFRLDEAISPGNDSQSINRGRISVKTPSGTVQAVLYAAPTMAGATGMPWLQLATLTTDPNVILIYKGIVTQGNASVYDIIAMRAFPAQPEPHGPFLELGNAELFIDTSTFQLVSAQDTVRGGGLRSIQYSNYNAVNGISLPFSITEEIGSTITRQVQFSQVRFNSGLQDSVFDLTQ
jgi:hypothetical protein